MENTSKALLIAAAVLVVIIVIAVGMKIYSSTTDAQKVGINTGKTISDKTGEATDLAIGEITENTKWTQNGEMISSGNTKVQIGDYIEYDCYTGVKASDRKYTSPSSKNGNSDQEFELTEADKTRKWRILGIDNNGRILITVSDPVLAKTSPRVLSTTTHNYALAFNVGYVNGPSELDNISKIYGHGKGAEGGRSITIEDINKITNYTSMQSVKHTYTRRDNKLYREDRQDASDHYFYYYDESNNEMIELENNNSIEVEFNSYSYILPENTNGQRMLKYKEDGTKASYWIASRCAKSDSAYYFPYWIRFANGDSVWGMGVVWSNGTTSWPSCLVRPVVTLLADIKLQSNGVNNWKIK